ncbi:MAG: hypothetical protein IJD86_08580 [Clostridia bacterium]|nr:hypothetical protein [Clostridia bacterium]
MRGFCSAGAGTSKRTPRKRRLFAIRAAVQMGTGAKIDESAKEGGATAPFLL